MPDPIFAHPRLAAIYDALDEPRDDLDAYMALVDEVGAHSVLDVGSGTGTLACLLAARGIEVVGVDPAEASLTVARAKPGAEQVSWLGGDATTLPPLAVDLAVMTGNVAQVFLTDEAWAATVRGVRDALRPGGTFALESRRPEREAWGAWTRDASQRTVEVSGAGAVESWVEVTDVDLPFVSFRWTYRFLADGAVLTSDSTLRFRTEDELRATLTAGGLVLEERRDAPDRPGLELVVLARRPDGDG